MRRRFLPLLFALPLCSRASDAPLSFNDDIRPILAENCFYCHGQDPNHRKGGLRLDQRTEAMKELEDGTRAIVPGKLDDSELAARIRSMDDDERMPPPDSHHSLTAVQKDILERWIAAGAEYQQHWAYVAPVRPALPEVKRTEWVRTPIDRFVLSRLEKEGLEPSPEADRATLIRRVTLDLIGLPPTPEEVDAFLADSTPDAYERVVDRLLANPHYGECMALPWLDAARYADSNGFQQDGDTYQWIWRDWVVKALNADMPFDEFSIEQLAGDLLPNATNEQKVATAFNRNHLLNGEGGAIAEEQRFNILFDRVDTTATNWLGLTMACSQCHDHKFDPITQRDYYGLLAAFNNLPESGTAPIIDGKMRIAAPSLELPSAENTQHLAELHADLEQLEKASKRDEKFEKGLADWRAKLTPETAGLPAEAAELLRMPARDEAQETKLTHSLHDHFEKKVWPDIAKNDPDLQKVEASKKAIKRYENEEVPRVMVMQDAQPRETHILERGNYENPKEKVRFATPAFLPAPAADAPQNRLGFARWLFQPDNPLTARVQVNRLWQVFFGTGLVKTCEDFGVQSEAPRQRELLDWLAVEFREDGWDMKAMDRLIVTSATYRQSSRYSPELRQRDPDNRLLARASRFRLPSLILRDAALAASGLLDERIGGKPVYPYQPEGIWGTLAITNERDFTYPQSTGADLYRRSLYTFWRRTASPADMFDAANRQTCRVRASVTSTPLHALTTLNDLTWVEASRVLAEHAMAAAPETDAQLTFVFRRILSATPKENELAMLRHALERQQAIYRADAKAAADLIAAGPAPRNTQLDPSEHAALTAVCLALFNLDQALSHE